MQILENFGVDPILLVAQIVNFLIIFWILKKFLYKKVLDVLKKRKITIEEGLKQAEEARVKLEKVLLEEKDILKKAQISAKEIVEDAKKESNELSKELSDKAKEQTDKMIMDAKDQIKRESLETEKRLASRTSELASAILDKALKEFFSSIEHEKALERALKKIKE
jgi:F-type H+-transporting ATPase subunit b